MRGAITAIVVAAAVLVAISMLGVASAEAPTQTAPLRTISVEGVGTLAVGDEDSAAAATAVYREAMSKALADGQSKASFLAGKVEGTLGQPDSVIEEGGDIECISTSGSGYAEYKGEQPDFGTGTQTNLSTAPTFSASSVAAPSSGASHVSHRPKRKKRHPKAKAAAVEATCNLSAEVALVYGIS
jgi:hypothetical protein